MSRKYLTLAAATMGMFEVMDLIKKHKPWTQFEIDDLGDWYGTDGVIEWEIRIYRSSFYSYQVDVFISGPDQMSYSWPVPLDGTPAEVVECCLAARQVDIDGGELWRPENRYMGSV